MKGSVVMKKSSQMTNLGSLLPKIRVKPPGPESVKIAEILGEYECPSTSSILLGETPVSWWQAKGANVVDVDSNLYVDLTGAFTVAVTGYSHPKVVDAIKKQCGILLHAQGAASPNVLRAQLVKKLVELTPQRLGKALVENTGSQAIEIAMKAAKAYKKRYWFLAFHQGFHGKNIQGALSLTARKSYRNVFHPLLPGVAHIPFAYCYRCAFGKKYSECDMQCLRYLEYIVTDPSTGVGEIAAIVLEPIQGHGGWIVPPDHFLPGVHKICDENDILLVLDEIITGFGRTGKLFCFEHYDIIPDLLCCGKGMASGFPISACIGRSEIMDALVPLAHTSTFLGNPLGCAATLANLDVIFEEKLVEKSSRLGNYLLNALKDECENCRLVGEIRGKGLMVGIELVRDREKKTPATDETRKIVKMVVEKGVLINSGGKFQNVLKLAPPLVITEEQLDCGIEAIVDAVKEVERNM